MLKTIVMTSAGHYDETIVLDESHWRTFRENLDRPVQDKPRLKKLPQASEMTG
jgi:uncharacterized protein (DUF1778 family)